MERRYKYIDLITVLFVTVLLLSNILSSAKIIDLGVSLLGLQFIFDAGTLVFPISYIFGDVLTEIYGYRRSRRVIWSGFFATALMAFFVWLAGVLPGESLWAETVGQSAYDAVLGSIWKLAIASLIAYFFGEFVNSYVLARMKVLMQGRWLWARTIGSTIAGQGVDTTVFFVIATALGVFPIELMLSLIVSNYIFKVSIEVIFTPITLRVIRWLKTSEQEDVYDHNTNFNPFRFDV
ncbi:MAG: queuosine precursor transporter [Chloroflexi bacterium]|uniref:queuosine precursor transporter n=1 Tax=Candidatus Flexifilum breve TaxID=3140694 RepID=UPI003135A13C|nr:queuosine precursor transporter [Chloroflexota bacterium]